MTCTVPGCTRPRALTYFDCGVCLTCWERHCDDRINLRVELGISSLPEGRERVASEPSLFPGLDMEVRR